MQINVCEATLCDKDDVYFSVLDYGCDCVVQRLAVNIPKEKVERSRCASARRARGSASRAGGG